MRIGFFCYSLSGAGPRIRSRNLINALAERMSENPVLVTNESSSFTNPDVEINRILSPQSLFRPKTILQIRNSLENCDVIHIPVNFYQLAYAAAIGLSPRVAGAGIQHEKRFRILTGLIGVDKMIETHELVAKSWDNSGINSTYIYPAVDTERFSPSEVGKKAEIRDRLGISPDDDVLLFVGELKPLKGAELMHDLAHQFSDENVTTVIVGDGEERHLFKDCDEVIFEGFIENEDLPQYYRTADLTIVPSRRESFSIVSLESIACGTPVVTTTSESCNMYRIFNQRGAYVWADRDPLSITNKIKQLLSDHDRYQEQVEIGFRTIEELKLSVTSSVEEYIDIYREVSAND